MSLFANASMTENWQNMPQKNHIGQNSNHYRKSENHYYITIPLYLHGLTPNWQNLPQKNQIWWSKLGGISMSQYFVTSF
jgi:hypothetical protein